MSANGEVAARFEIKFLHWAIGTHEHFIEP